MLIIIKNNKLRILYNENPFGKFKYQLKVQQLLWKIKEEKTRESAAQYPDSVQKNTIIEPSLFFQYKVVGFLPNYETEFHNVAESYFFQVLTMLAVLLV